MRRVKRAVQVVVWVLFLAMANCWLPSCDGLHDSGFTQERLLTVKREDLKATTITPILDEPIPPGRNVLWCGTFQLAWNETCALVGEDLHFDRQPAMATALNAKAFSRPDVDEDSFIALAGFVRDGIFARIDQALKEKFHGHASPHYLPSPGLTPRPQDIVAYSYLSKHLEFPIPFEKVDDGMSFNRERVEAFGLPYYKPDDAQRYGQVMIHDYRSADDFVIELVTKSAGDRLVLAKVTPADSLAATIQAVRKRMDGNNRVTMARGDVLLAPKMNFDLTADYHELCGGTLSVKNPKVAKDLSLLSAVQNIRFQIDEKGVRLRSESHMSFGCGLPDEPRPTHKLIFDKPFLVMLQKRSADRPYFALWLGNAELLEKR